MELQTPEVRLANARRVVEAMDALRINYGLTADTLLQASTIDLEMLVLHFYQVGR